jgi:hypothetical protein
MIACTGSNRSEVDCGPHHAGVSLRHAVGRRPGSSERIATVGRRGAGCFAACLGRRPWSLAATRLIEVPTMTDADTKDRRAEHLAHRIEADSLDRCELSGTQR